MKINKNINHKKLWLDSMTGMSMGFFSTLIVGSFIGIIGLYSKNNIFNDIKSILTILTPFAIGIGVGLKAKLEPLQILALAITSMLAAQSLIHTRTTTSGHMIFNEIQVRLNLNILSQDFASPGDVMTSWIASALLLYFFETLKWRSTFDFLLIPFIGIVMGLFFALWLTYIVSIVTTVLEWIIYHIDTKGAVLTIVLSPIIGAIMGLALTLPISSAAIAFTIHLHGDAAIAAIAGTSAQMLSFGMFTWWSTKSISKTIAVGLGSSKLYMANYAKKPVILIVPVIVSALTALISVGIFHGTLAFSDKPSTTSGMGTCAFYGQIFTLKENGWDNLNAWINVVFMQLLLPLVLTFPLLYFADKKSILKKEWFILWNNTQQNTLVKQVK